MSPPRVTRQSRGGRNQLEQTGLVAQKNKPTRIDEQTSVLLMTSMWAEILSLCEYFVHSVTSEYNARFLI
jgi:hypothetical protein